VRGAAGGAVLVLALAGCVTPPASDPSAELVALERDLVEHDDYALRWQAARAALGQVDAPETPSAERITYARRALGHAQAAAALGPARVEGHFYTAVALGRVLQHASLPNPGQIGELEAAGVRAREVDPTFRCGGPLRLLALLYQKAPAWPVGPELAGEEDEIEALFAEAVRVAPACPENLVAFAEFLVEQGRKDEAVARARQARKLLTRGSEREVLAPWELAELHRRAREVISASRP